MARAKRRIGSVDGLSFKAMVEKAVNSPKIAEVSDADAALNELVEWDSTPRYQGNRMLSPFGHNATATNGDIDFALCNGARTLDDVIDKVNQYRKTRKADHTKRELLAKRVIEHTRFLAGINNGKNRLADRIARFMGDEKWDACVAMEGDVYRMMSPVHVRMNKAYLANYK